MVGIGNKAWPLKALRRRFDQAVTAGSVSTILV